MNRPLKTVLPFRPAHAAATSAPARVGVAGRGRLDSFLAPLRSSFKGRSTK